MLPGVGLSAPGSFPPRSLTMFEQLYYWTMFFFGGLSGVVVFHSFDKD